MELHVPTAPHRPGDAPRFAPFQHQPGDLPRPDTLAPHDELREHATGLIRVLGDDGAAAGPWQPQLSAAAASQRPGDDAARAALRRAHDRHAAAGAVVVLRFEQGRGSGRRRRRDGLRARTTCCFPAIARPGLLLVRGMPMLAMMCQTDRQPVRQRQGPADAGALQLAGRQRGVDLQPGRHAVSAGGRRGDGVCLSRRAASRRRMDRRRHGGPGRFSLRAEFRVGVSAAVRAARGRQPMGDQHASQSGDRRRDVCRAGRCVSPARTARRRQRLSGRVRGRGVGDRTGPARRRTDAHRAGHLSPRRPFDERRSDPVSRRRRSRHLARRRPDRATQAASDSHRRMVGGGAPQT